MSQKDNVNNIICPNCKKVVRSDDSFCRYCGFELKPKDSIVYIDSKKSLSNRLVLIFSFLLLLLVALIFIINKNLKNNTNNLKTDVNTEQVPSTQLINQQKISELKAIVERNPKDLDNLISLANLLHDSDLPAEAIIYYKKYLELNNKNADAMVDMAICYFNLGDNETAKKQINEAIKRTFAEMEDTPIRTRSSIRKKKKKERLEEQQRELEQQERERSIIRVTEFTSVNELANIMNVKVTDVMQKCFSLGMMVSINQRLDSDTIQLVADEFGYQVEFQKELITDSLVDVEDDPSQLVPRAPVVTIMGHVDHGKTSLLDYIRNANVVAGEAGGITQHIGAYKVVLDNGKEITFIDTPGHEAFTSMRARGAKITDIVVLVVAADDNVMPQTVEAISHAQAANVPIIVAINKIDKPNANPDRIRQQLSEKNILVEEWGGKYQSVEISAKFGKNVDLLLEKILLEAEILDLKANPNRNARGVIIEAELDKGKGIVATALIQKGTLKIGDPFIAGIYSGKVRAMFDERGNRVETAKPSTPIQLLGFDGIPQAGDEFIVLNSEKEAKEISSQRQLLKREQDFRQVHLVTLDDISQHIKEGGTQELNIIVKGDVDGSVEALSDSLMKLSNNEVKVKVIHRSVGAISESDVLLAAASQAIIIGFNVRPNMNARKLAEKEAIEIRLYNIIYNAINDVKAALEGMLAPEVSEEIVATVEVREVFKVPKVGTVAGCYVQEGKITRNTKVRLIRDGIVIVNQCNIASLKRFKDDVREVDAGFECGIGLENYNDIKVGDIIEGYRIVEKKRKLQLDKV